MNENIIVVKQLPQIEEHLQTIKEVVTTKVNDALSLVCNENTVKSGCILDSALISHSKVISVGHYQ